MDHISRIFELMDLVDKKAIHPVDSILPLAMMSFA